MTASHDAKWLSVLKVRGLLILLCLALVVSVTPTSARATTPGSNGLIYAVTVTSNIAYRSVAIQPDGTLTELDRFASNLDMGVGSLDGRSILTEEDESLRLLSTEDWSFEDIVGQEQIGEFEFRPHDPVWSPTQADVFAYLVDDQLVVTTVEGEERQRITIPEEYNVNDGLGWAQDGTIIGFGENFGENQYLLHIDLATGGIRQVILPSFGEGFAESGGLSPDGTQVVYTCQFKKSKFERLRGMCTASVEGELLTRVEPLDGARITNLAWSPDGTRVLFTDSIVDNLYSSALDGTDRRLLLTEDDFEGIVWMPEVEVDPPSQEPLVDGGFDGDADTTERADFADPTSYAIAVSRARFADGGADHVVLSRDDVFPDSLVGAALTGDGPLLFTTPTALPAQTAEEIGRVLEDGDTVYILGGTVAVSQTIEDTLAQDFDVVRLSGPSRVETSVAVAREVIEVSGVTADLTVAIARADGLEGNPTAGWADSVSVGAWTAAETIPTVVTPTQSVHPAVEAFLTDVDVARSVLLGGTAALSEDVAGAVPSPQRVAGDNRAGTAAAIAAELVGLDTGGDRRLVVINGFREDGWLFGLPAAGLAADAGAALGLVGDTVPPETLTLACSAGSTDVLLAGANSVIAPSIVAELDAAPAC